MTDDDPEFVKRYHPAMPPSTLYGLREIADRGLNVEVGRYSYGVPRVSWKAGDTTRKLTIGSFCSIADNVRIYVGVQGRHPIDFLSTYPIGMVFGRPERVPGTTAATSAVVKGNLNVDIGSDVWLGLDTVILAGCRIGHGACVGTRSLVTGDIPPYAIVGGTPAKLIRYRFDADTVAKLLQIRWWDWPDEMIRKNLGLFFSDDVPGTVSAILARQD